MVKNGLPLPSLAYAIYIIKILKVPHDLTIGYYLNISRDQIVPFISLHLNEELMRSPGLETACEEVNCDHGGEEEPTNDPVVNSEGDDSSAMQLEAEVSDLKQEIIHLKSQIHHLSLHFRD